MIVVLRRAVIPKPYRWVPCTE